MNVEALFYIAMISTRLQVKLDLGHDKFISRVNHLTGLTVDSRVSYRNVIAMIDEDVVEELRC